MSLNIWLRIFFVWFLVNILLASCQAEVYSDISIADARINDETDPMGIDVENPCFSWKLISEKRNRIQMAFKHLLIVPQLTVEIPEQKTRFISPYYQVAVSWNHQASAGLQLEIEIPVNTKANVFLPVSGNEMVYESGKKLSEDGEIKLISTTGNGIRIGISSGKYFFEIK